MRARALGGIERPSDNSIRITDASPVTPSLSAGLLPRFGVLSRPSFCDRADARSCRDQLHDFSSRNKLISNAIRALGCPQTL